jgi:type IV pilus assembly protein PilA
MTQAMTVQNKKNIRKNRKGFTLIELIVVIAILAILAAIAIPAFTGSLNNAKKGTDEASARTIVSAVQLGVAEGTYTLSGTNGPNVGQLVTDGYLEKAPVVQSGNGGDFTIAYADGKLTTVTGDGTVFYTTAIATPTTGG